MDTSLVPKTPFAWPYSSTALSEEAKPSLPAVEMVASGGRRCSNGAPTPAFDSVVVRYRLPLRGTHRMAYRFRGFGSDGCVSPSA